MVTETRDLQQVELCLTHVFKYLGGVPHEILFDNMRSIIDKARTQYLPYRLRQVFLYAYRFDAYVLQSPKKK